MGFFQISSNELRRKEEELMGLLQKFDSQKEELTSEEITLKSMWQGEANESFHEAFIKDLGQMESFIEIVTNYAVVMGNIADRYDSAESRNLGIAGRGFA